MNDLYFNIDLPFYTGVKAGTSDSFSSVGCYQEENLINLPFALYLDKEYLIPRLYVTKKIQTAINASYENGSMLSTPLGTSSLSNNRLTEFLNCLKTKVSDEFINKKFIEIGSGTGHLLYEVKQLGADVTGFEIGPQAQKYSKEFGINVVNDYFKPSLLKQKVDCVFSSGCLEHIIELDSFMEDSFAVLKKGGLFFASVPNALPPFEGGSVEHLCHEHVNYFTIENGIRFLKKCGFIDCGANTNSVGNEIFLWGYKPLKMSMNTSELELSADFERELTLLKSYEKALNLNLPKTILALQSLVANSDKQIGFYGGGDLICHLANIQQDSRFFDGDEAKWGSAWMPGLSNIENPKNLITSEVDHLIICVEHYAPEILKYLNEEKIVNQKLKIHLLAELGI
tara:strand:- start:585 stop:1778 length:1194 start_codon:yes stop_codon:yes gene_type:complete